MNRNDKAAVIIELVKRLRDNGNWCGETHLQKAIYFLQALLLVPLDFEYILYKHGPYSFELTDELSRFLFEGFLNIEPHHGYGPSFYPGTYGEILISRYSETINTYNSQLSHVSEIIGRKKVIELERLATAYFVSLEMGDSRSREERARRLVNLKPHIAYPDAFSAVEEIDSIRAQVTSVAE
ncbi:MAG: hypothetical protein GYA46_08325 [candidate division Zixibacteria bacterium]|nr:hypothetical protein [candidate division Zixibacteria bacterium]